METGVITLGELLSDPHLGKKISPRQRLEEILAAAELADQAGLDVFGVGEHHRLDFVGSGKIRAGYLGRKQVGTNVSRADLAAFLLAQARDTTWLRQAPAVSN